MQQVFTNRVLVDLVNDKIDQDSSYRELNYTFELIQTYEVGSEIIVEKYEPVINQDLVPYIFVVTYKTLERKYLVHQPDEFHEDTASFYVENFGFIFDSIDDVNNGEYEMVGWINDDEINLTLSKTHEVTGERNDKTQLDTFYIYESDDRDKDDRCIIITESYDPENETYFLNFLDGEEIDSIDIEEQEQL